MKQEIEIVEEDIFKGGQLTLNQHGACKAHTFARMCQSQMRRFAGLVRLHPSHRQTRSYRATRSKQFVIRR